MNKIKLKHNPYGDSRHAPKNTTFKQFHSANISHIKDVKRVMYKLAKQIKKQGKEHDWTKLRYENMFYEDFLDTLLTNTNFVNNNWYQLHIEKEKHHPSSKCHDDITLLDIIETIVDCICAGKARSGEIRPLEFNTEILEKAVKNTVALIDIMTEVEVDE